MPVLSKIVFSAIVACLCTATVYGQGYTNATTTRRTPVKAPPPKEKPIKNELSFGYRLHTDGWSLYSDIGKIKAKNNKTANMFYNVNVWQIELSEKKDPRQEKLTVSDNTTGNTSNYVYGKINNFYALKLGYGKRKLLAGKPDPGAVSIHWTNIIGASMGMLKPYYLNVESNPEAIKYTDDNQAYFLNQNNIYGSAGFSMGLSEMKIIAGGHFKSMLHFDFAANKFSVLALETGLAAEYYAEPVSLMYNQKAQPYFVNLFMAFQFGKRW
jgi:hypothetical protein